MNFGVARTLPLLKANRATAKTDRVREDRLRDDALPLVGERLADAADEQALGSCVGQDQRRVRRLLERHDQAEHQAGDGAAEGEERVVEHVGDRGQRQQDGEHDAGLDDDVVDRHPTGVDRGGRRCGVHVLQLAGSGGGRV